MLSAIADAAIRHRRLTFVCTAVLALVALLGVLRLRVDFSSTAFYGGDEEQRAQLEAFVSRWGADDRTLVVLVEAEDALGVITPERLETIERLRQVLAEHPHVTRSDAITSLPIPPDDRPLIEHVRQIESVQEGLRARTRLLARPAIVPLLVSADGRATAVLAVLDRSTDDLGATVPVVEDISTLLGTFDGRAGLHVAAAGVPAVRAGFFALVLHDQTIFVPVTLLVIAVLLWLSFGRLHAVVVPLAGGGLPLLGLLGVMGWAGEPIGLINQAYFTLIPVIAVADAVHLVSRTHEEAIRCTDDPSPSVRRRVVVCATARVGWACLLTTITTGIGFASLGVGSAPVIVAFGAWAALGIVLAFVVVVTFVPAALSLVVDPRPSPKRHGAMRRWVVGASSVASRRPWWVLAVTAVVLTSATWGATRVEVDNRLSALLDADHPVRRASETVDRKLGGILSLEVELRAPPGTWTSPEGRRMLEQFEDWAAAQPEVRAVVGPGRLGLDRRLVDEAGSHARVSLRVPDRGGRVFTRLQDRVREHLDALGIDAVVTGTTAIAYRGVNRITRDLRVSLVLVFVVVTLVIGVLLRSSRSALVTVPPNVLPLVVGYGAFGLLRLELDPLATVVLVVALGIAVDDTIHLLVRVHEERARVTSVVRVVQRAVDGTGRPVAITSVVLAAGLAMNLGSSFPPLRVLGGLGAAVILLALASDLLVLPALLVLTQRRRSSAHEPRSGSESREATRD